MTRTSDDKATRCRKWLPALASLTAVAGLAAYLCIFWQETWQSLTTVQPVFLIGCLAIDVIHTFANGMVKQAALQARGVNIGPLECFWLGNAACVGNLVLPQGGMAVHAVYLRRRFGLSVADYFAVLLGTQLALLAVTCVLALLCLSAVGHGSGHAGLSAANILAGCYLAAAILLGFLPRLKVKGRWPLDKIVTIVNGWHDVRSRPWLLAKICALTLLLRACNAASFWFTCKMMGLDPGILAVLTIACVVWMATFVNLTPSGIGVDEAIVGVVGSALGLPPVATITGSLVGRSIGLPRDWMLGTIAAWRLSRRLTCAPGSCATRGDTRSDSAIPQPLPEGVA